MTIFQINLWLLKFKALIFIENFNNKETKAIIKETLSTEFGDFNFFYKFLIIKTSIFYIRKKKINGL
jgi:hypothetical protein